MRRSLRARVALLCALGAAIFLPSIASADVKEECVNAAEKAQALRRDEKLRAARAELLLCVRDSCPSFVHSDCVKWLGEVDQSMPTVVIRARDAAGHDAVDVKVSVDGQAFLPKLQGTSVPIDPGEHQFKYEFPSGQTVLETVLVAEGEKDRVLSVVPNVGAAPPPTTGGTEPSAGGVGPGPWILIGIGAASLVGFGVVETLAQVRYADYTDTCGKTHTCDASKVSSLGVAFGTGIALLGVGVVGVGVGLTWLLVGGGKHAEKLPAPSTTAFDVRPLPGGGMLTWAGRF